MSRVCAVGSRTPRLAPARGLSWDAADVRLAGCRERCMGQCMDVMLCYVMPAPGARRGAALPARAAHVAWKLSRGGGVRPVCRCVPETVSRACLIEHLEQ